MIEKAKLREKKIEKKICRNLSRRRKNGEKEEYQ